MVSLFCKRQSKFIFLAVNLLVWILGCICFSIGVWLYVTKTVYMELAPASYGALSAAGLCIAAGATVLVVGFVGCCGAWIESKCLLLTYIVFMILVFFVVTTAGILGLIYRAEVNQIMREELRAQLKSPFVANSARDPSGKRITWDRMQEDLECCGVDSYRDWFFSPSWDKQEWVPDSCCDVSKVHNDSVSTMHNCGKMRKPELWYQEGCNDKFTDWVLQHIRIVAVIGLLLSFVQIFAIIASFSVYCYMRSTHHMLIPTEESTSTV